MIHLLLKEIEVQVNNYLRMRGTLDVFKCIVSDIISDITTHDKSSDGGSLDDIQGNVIVSMVSLEEEPALKNNQPLRQVGAALVKEKSAIFLNVYVLFAAKYNDYNTALEAISLVILFFQTNRRITFSADDQSNRRFSFSANDQPQEAVLSLHNIGFETLNNLWTVLGGRYLPSVMYKARVLMYQASPPTGQSVILEIEGSENLS
jgi:hypothetical protein